MLKHQLYNIKNNTRARQVAGLFSVNIKCFINMFNNIYMIKRIE